MLALAIGRDGNEIANGDSSSFSSLFLRHSTPSRLHPSFVFQRDGVIKQAAIDGSFRESRFLENGNGLSSPGIGM